MLLTSENAKVTVFTLFTVAVAAGYAGIGFAHDGPEIGLRLFVGEGFGATTHGLLVEDAASWSRTCDEAVTGGIEHVVAFSGRLVIGTSLGLREADDSCEIRQVPGIPGQSVTALAVAGDQLVVSVQDADDSSGVYVGETSPADSGLVFEKIESEVVFSSIAAFASETPNAESGYCGAGIEQGALGLWCSTQDGLMQVELEPDVLAVEVVGRNSTEIMATTFADGMWTLWAVARTLTARAVFTGTLQPTAYAGRDGVQLVVVNNTALHTLGETTAAEAMLTPAADFTAVISNVYLHGDRIMGCGLAEEGALFWDLSDMERPEIVLTSAEVEPAQCETEPILTICQYAQNSVPPDAGNTPPKTTTCNHVAPTQREPPFRSVWALAILAGSLTRRRGAKRHGG